ncbi:MAG: DUF2796 domain-containing protein [Synechococcus sp.]
MKVFSGCVTIAATASLICFEAKPARSQITELIADSHQAETRQEESHVHGIVEMNVAVEGSQLYIELVSPAANIVGFEHAPNTDEQEAAVDNAIAVLEAGDNLLGLPVEAECSLVTAAVESDIHSGEGDGHSEHEGEHEDEHSEHEDEHSGHEDEHEHKHSEHEEEVHSEFVANYEFDCANPEQLQQIEVGLFETFPGIEEIEVQALTDSGQVGKNLTPTDPILSW